MSQRCIESNGNQWFLLTGNDAHISISANVSSLHSMPFALVESAGDCMNGGRGGGGMWNFGGGPGPSHASVPHSKSPSNIFHIESIYFIFLRSYDTLRCPPFVHRVCGFFSTAPEVRLCSNWIWQCVYEIGYSSIVILHFDALCDLEM